MEGNEKLNDRIGLLYKLRVWESNNLPIAKTNAGYHLLLLLSKSLLVGNEDIRLKNIYHSLSFSEKTLRLLLRELERDGWIEMPNKTFDPRHKDIVPTTKFNSVLKAWSTQIDLLFYKS